ncbi:MULTISPECIES: SCO family protein [Lysinibacillus]|uniref:SCO family protein n=1 Tax=Lysinibacillus varians TaxID=1145276 RepID=A0ABY2T7T4_9BACI|nr:MULTISPECIES: SCO family protein [Lysinibacillus]AHN21610.1 photosynthetic protein synthase I [Lysinibacillus varians]MCS1382186.1 SCO family protein [Lysinibacillus sphaericus]TKI59806.1 SCO family protein [Lysinibacillus varians]
MKNKVMWFVLLLTLVTVLSACGNAKFKADYSLEMQDFEHINQRGETVSLDSLKGKPWLGMYIFTNCNSVCPPMTFNMTQVQEKLKKKGIEDYNIVAFSVDPEVDTPEVLADYLTRYTVPDESKWNLLTGYSQSYIEQYAVKSTKLLVKDDPNSDQVIHGIQFFLVDKDGILVKQYDGYAKDANDVPIDTIVSDLETYIDENL